MVKYYYIDDDPKSYDKIQGFECDDLVIKAVQHQDSWEKQLNYLKSNEQNFDGLILDLKLDDSPNEHNIRAEFRGTSLAQEIRTRQKEGELKSFPIILFSANDKIQLALENSGKDLFDICIDKSDIRVESFAIYGPQMIALVSGYRKLLSSIDCKDKIFSIETSLLDSRFLSEFDNIKSSPIHLQARFLISELLEKQGLLINEDVLAARLGIDKEKSSDWNLLKEKMTSAQYMGAFSEGWTRWWMPLIDKWWSKDLKADTSLRSSSAKERVKRIQKFYQFSNLIAAERIDKSNSDEFWTVCMAYNRPLDPVDGLLIQGQDNLYPWQEPLFVSIDAALKRKNNEKWKDLADIEKNYFEELKVMYKPKKVN
jgi:hypothetical protein